MQYKLRPSGRCVPGHPKVQTKLKLKDFLIRGTRGDERLLSLYWFIMFIIIAIAVVSGVVLFYSYPFDVRPAEANLLADKILTCIVNQGYIKQQFLKPAAELSLFDVCGIASQDATHLAYQERRQYGAELKIQGESVLSDGDVRLLRECDIAVVKRNIPICVERNLTVLALTNGDREELVQLTITTAVRKIEQNGK